MAKANKKWVQLAELAHLAYTKELSKLVELKAAQATLFEQRSKLRKINDRALQDFGKPHPAHWHNGDVLWQTWVNRNGRAISIEEARLKALAEIHRPELKKAFGRKNALESLVQGKTR